MKLFEVSCDPMLARYKLYRGARPPHDPLPDGVRQDTRKHTRHVLRPTAEMVTTFLADPTPANWRRFATEYRALLEERFRADRAPFDELAQLATERDVFLGCSCPTEKNPDVRHCHTVLALEFMRKRYPRLRIEMPG